MRALAIAGLLCATAAADPLRVRAVTEQTRDPRPEVRVAAARELAGHILYGDRSRAAALVAVLSNDPDVRAPLATTLIAAHVIDPSSAARIPSFDTLDTMLHVLVHDPLLTAKECAVAATDPHTITIECDHTQCARLCRRESATLTLAIGSRWTVITHDHKTVDDGTCGDCE